MIPAGTWYGVLIPQVEVEVEVEVVPAGTCASINN